jgi:hypothetical protein
MSRRFFLVAHMKSHFMPWEALLVAPLASVPVLVLTGLGSSEAGILSDLYVGLVFGVFMGLPLAYLFMALVGLPLYLLLRRVHLLRLWTMCPLYALVPLALFYDSSLRFVCATAGSGIAIGAAAYFLAPEESKHET